MASLVCPFYLCFFPFKRVKNSADKPSVASARHSSFGSFDNHAVLLGVVSVHLLQKVLNAATIHAVKIAIYFLLGHILFMLWGVSG